MAVNRVHKKGNFSTISNDCINDEALSFAARGMLCYLLSKPDKWIIRTGDLVKRSPHGEIAVNSILKELESKGYVIRWCDRGDRGKFEWRSEIFETKRAAQEWYIDHEDELNQAFRLSAGTEKKLGRTNFTIPLKPMHGQTICGKQGDIENTDHANNSSLNTNINTNKNTTNLFVQEKVSIDQEECFDREEKKSVKTKKKPNSENQDSPVNSPVQEVKAKKNPNPLPPSPQVESVASSPKIKEVPQLKPNDQGWLQLPKARSYSLARAITVRRIQYQLALLFPNVKIALSEEKEITVLWDCEGVEGEFAEDKIFGADGDFNFTTLRNEAFDNDLISQKTFNEFLQAIFDDSVEWARIQGAHAVKTMKTSSLASEFCERDQISLAHLRWNPKTGRLDKL